MARPRQFCVRLTDEEYGRLNEIVTVKRWSKTVQCRCKIIMELDENHGGTKTYKQIAQDNRVCIATVFKSLKKYEDGGIGAVTTLNRSINSDLARRVVDEHIISCVKELLESPVPKGYKSWTTRLIEQYIKENYDISVSRETIRRLLKDMESIR